MNNRAIPTAIFFIAMRVAASAQSVGDARFEVASIRRAQPSADTTGRIQIAGDRLAASNRTLAQLLNYAYGLGCCDLLHAPSWIGVERYDISAKAPENTPPDRIAVMLQNLLVERFKLVLHRETKDLPIYELARGKGKLRLERAESAALKNDWSMDGGHRSAKSMSMATLAVYISQTLRTPVLDKTGLDGYYNFPFDLSREETLRDSAPSLFSIVDDLGLALHPGKAPFDIVVVDSGSANPAED